MSKTGNFLTEFKKFALKGNMIDLAVGVIIGATFSKIVDSLVKDVLMPLISFLLGGKVDFSNLFFVLSAPEGLDTAQSKDKLIAAGANVLSYGNFLTTLLNFFLIALVLFIMVKIINEAREAIEPPAPPAAPPAPPADVVLLSEIRDLLKNK